MWRGSRIVACEESFYGLVDTKCAYIRSHPVSDKVSKLSLLFPPVKGKMSTSSPKSSSLSEVSSEGGHFNECFAVLSMRASTFLRTSFSLAMVARLNKHRHRFRRYKSLSVRARRTVSAMSLRLVCAFLRSSNQEITPQTKMLLFRRGFFSSASKSAEWWILYV